MISMDRIERLSSYDPSEVIVIDTETTGTSLSNDEILSLAIIDMNGETLFNELFKPEQRKSWPKAQAIHGITPAMVKSKNTISEYAKNIELIIKKSKLIVGYNLEFDLNFLESSGINIPKRAKCDVMREFAKAHGEWNTKYREYAWCKLADCAKFYGCKDFVSHEALSDARTTAYCFACMLDDSDMWTPRKRPKTITDEYGSTYVEYGDEWDRVWSNNISYVLNCKTSYDANECHTAYFYPSYEFSMQDVSEPEGKHFKTESTTHSCQQNKRSQIIKVLAPIFAVVLILAGGLFGLSAYAALTARGESLVGNIITCIFLAAIAIALIVLGIKVRKISED